MKVSIANTIHVSDRQRVQIADLLDGKESKRMAKSDEIKKWILGATGHVWAFELSDQWGDEFGVEEPDVEDLIGGTIDDSLSDLIGDPAPTDDDLIGDIPVNVSDLI